MHGLTMRGCTHGLAYGHVAQSRAKYSARVNEMSFYTAQPILSAGPYTYLPNLTVTYAYISTIYAWIYSMITNGITYPDQCHDRRHSHSHYPRHPAQADVAKPKM